MSDDTLAAAIRYVEAGYSVIPVRGTTAKDHDGAKKPAPGIRWQEFQERLPTLEELEHWFSNNGYGIGLILGKLSGLCAVDDDRDERVEGETYIDLTPLRTPTAATPSGNRIVLFRFPSDKPFGKYDRISAQQVRGEGHYVVVPPTRTPAGTYGWLPSCSPFDVVPLGGPPSALVGMRKITATAQMDLAEHNVENGRCALWVEGAHGCPQELLRFHNDIDVLAAMREGEDRTKEAFNVARRAVRRPGCLSRGYAEAKIREAATVNGSATKYEDIQRHIANGFEARETDGLGTHDARKGAEDKSAGPHIRVVSWDEVPPAKKLLLPYPPLWFEASLYWLFGPSGVAKSTLTDWTASELSVLGVHSLILDWEDSTAEMARVERMGAALSYVHFAEYPATIGEPGFAEDMLELVSHYAARFVVFNPFFLYAPDAVGETDPWNAPVRTTVEVCRRIIHETGATVVLQDHAEEGQETAHGGKSKKWLTDAYLRMWATDGPYVRGQPFAFAVRDEKRSRLRIPECRGRVVGPEDGWLGIEWTEPVKPAERTQGFDIS